MMAPEYRILLVEVFLIAGVPDTMTENKARNASA